MDAILLTAESAEDAEKVYLSLRSEDKKNKGRKPLIHYVLNFIILIYSSLTTARLTING